MSATSTTPRPGGAGRYEALGMLMALAFLNYLDRNLVYPLLNLISESLHLSEPELGALATGFHVVYACSAPLVGYGADRLRRKTVLLIALISWSVVTALSGTATGFFSLLLWRSLTGLGEGGYFPTAISLVGDLFDRHERGRAIALHGVCTTLGGSAGYALGGVLGASLGWRGPFLLAVVPGVLLALLIWRRLDEPERGVFDETRRESAVSGEVGSSRSYLATVSSPAVLLVSLAASLAAVAMNALNTFFPKYLADVRRFSVARAGVLSGVFFSATLVGQIGGGFFSDRLALRVEGLRPLLVAFSYLCCVPAALAIFYSEPVLVGLAAYGLTQLCRGFAEPNIYGTIIDAVPAESRGSAQGFLLALTFAGASVSPLLSGFLLKRGGFRLVFLLVTGACALAGIFAVVLGLRLRRRCGSSSASRGGRS